MIIGPVVPDARENQGETKMARSAAFGGHFFKKSPIEGLSDKSWDKLQEEADPGKGQKWNHKDFYEIFKAVTPETPYVKTLANPLEAYEFRLKWYNTHKIIKSHPDIQAVWPYARYIKVYLIENQVEFAVPDRIEKRVEIHITPNQVELIPDDEGFVDVSHLSEEERHARMTPEAIEAERKAYEAYDKRREIYLKLMQDYEDFRLYGRIDFPPERLAELNQPEVAIEYQEYVKRGSMRMAELFQDYKKE